MHELLYSIINPLIALKKRGHIALTHEIGKSAKIALRKGRITCIETGSLRGADAVREVAMWIFFDHQFVDEPAFLDAPLTQNESENYLAFLAKVDFKQNELQVALEYIRKLDV